MSDESVTIPVIKYGLTIPMTDELAFPDWGQKFPRRGHTITHPITEKIRIEYAAFAERWNAARKEWDDVTEQAEKLGWGRGVGGYEWEDAELFPLVPVREWMPDETVEEHYARVQNILDHHKETGEWLEKPAASISEIMMLGIMNAFTKEVEL